MKNPSPKDDLRALRDALARLDLDAVAIEVDQLSAGRVQAWRPNPAPARSAETPMPVRDRYDVWLEARALGIEKEMREALAHVCRALAAQDALLAAMTLADAQHLLASEHDRPLCVVCGVEVPKGELRSGRCQADYRYRARHGHDTPRTIWTARAERVA